MDINDKLTNSLSVNTAPLCQEMAAYIRNNIERGRMGLPNQTLEEYQTAKRESQRKAKELIAATPGMSLKERIEALREKWPKGKA